MKPTELDAAALAVFARKGREGGPGVPQAGDANAAKVRRVLQLTEDLAGPLPGLRVLDLGCGEGVYAIEAACGGAEVLAVDARRVRMDEGEAIARRHGLDRVHFALADVRDVTPETHGAFDVVWALGILYHLDAPEVFALLARMAQLARRLVVIDTLVALAPEVIVHHGGLAYEGARYREHADDDPPEVRRARPLKSIDNTWSFRLSRAALVRALSAAGFTSVLEVHAPLEPGKPSDRVTFVARPGRPVALVTYPWLAALSEAELAARLAVEAAPS